jgi:tRNA pseudouridine65 synthase
LFALDAGAARSLQDPAAGPNLTKRYLALVRGRPAEQGLIDHPISNRPDGPRVSAVTAFRRLYTAASQPREVSLVEVVPRTGRLHQVRRHLKHINHPLIRDTNYGNAPLNHALGEAYGLTRLALHAYRLAFRHPVSGQDLQVTAGLPADLAEPFAKMGIPPGTWTALEAPKAADWLEGLNPQDRLA